MNNSSNGFNRMWIYAPLYFLFTGLCVWALYTYLNVVPKVVEPVVTPMPIKETIDTKFRTCFTRYKNALGGLFELIPTRELGATFAEIDNSCFEEICNELKYVKNGKYTSAHFYNLVKKGNSCFEPVLSATLSYHHQQLEELPLLSLFFNSGQSELSSSQKNQLDAFLRYLKKDAEDYGLLIIGRASKVGHSDINKKLSRKRAEQIIFFTDNHYIKNLKTQFVYFGADPPQLNIDLAKRYGIRSNDYENVSYGSGRDRDYSLRLNQSALLVIYPIAEDPFGLEENR